MSDRQDAIQAMATGMQLHTVLVGARREELREALDAVPKNLWAVQRIQDAARERLAQLEGDKNLALVLAETALDALLELLDEKGWTELDESASGGVGHYLWRLSPEGER